MADFSTRWASALKETNKKQTGGFPTYEDGDYIMQLVDAWRGESKASGRHQVVWEYVIVDGPSKKGEVYRSYDGLETENNMKFVAITLKRMGVQQMPKDELEFDAMLSELTAEEPTFFLSLVTNGKYQNIRNLRKLKEDEEKELPPVDDEPEEVEVE